MDFKIKWSNLVSTPQLHPFLQLIAPVHVDEVTHPARRESENKIAGESRMGRVL